MIVRILGEGQYDLSEESVATLNELDARVEAAIEAGDGDILESEEQAIQREISEGGPA